MKCPCIECISYAMCKQKVEIKCNELYIYIGERNSFPKELPNTSKVYRSASRIFAHLDKGTTRWYPDS